MPLYHYICGSCEKHFEIRHRYNNTDNVCIFCKSSSIKKHLGNKSTVTTNKKVTNKQVGAEVHKAIKDGKIELETTKKDLSKKRNRDE